MKKVLFVAIALIASLTIAAQTNDEATLTVSGSAENEEKATLVALRSAIEQTYGTFVSANTEIVNDELTKDDIVSVSSGNISEYKVLSSALLANGNTAVTLQVKVAIGNLVQYAKNHGSSVEFAGATFAMNTKMKKLQSDNTVSAFLNMYAQIEAMAPLAFDFRIQKVGNPKSGSMGGYLVPVTIEVLSNETTAKIYELVHNTIKALALKEEPAQYEQQTGIRTYHIGDIASVNAGSKKPVSTELACVERKIGGDKYNRWGKKQYFDNLFFPIGHNNIERLEEAHKRVSLKLMSASADYSICNNEAIFSIPSKYINSFLHIYYEREEVRDDRYDSGKRHDEYHLHEHKTWTAWQGEVTEKNVKQGKKKIVQKAYLPKVIGSYEVQVPVTEEQMMKLTGFEIKKVHNIHR